MSSGMSHLNLQKLDSQKRTEGDGMENTDNETKSTEDRNKAKVKDNLMDKFIYRPLDLKETSFSPPPIKGQIVHLMPKNVTPIKKEGMFPNIFGGREPKFVPYEPYKAAVKPIVPYGKSKRRKDIRPSEVLTHIGNKSVCQTNNSNNDVDDNVQEKSKELDENEKKSETEDNASIQETETDIKQIEIELKRLKEENEQLESQLKFQAQVNGELKNLLVAAMGEDLETRVHLLTEDKLHLARALLNSAQKLSTHQEQTEYLASQCEVWQSKFLASSLMVEELAKWKAALCHKASELQDTMKRILDERSKVRESLINTHRELNLLSEKFDLTALRGGRRISGLNSSNVTDLSSTNQALSTNLRIQLLGDDETNNKYNVNYPGLEMTTAVERQAEQLILHPLALLGQTDAACSAVMGAAVALGASKMYAPGPACCAHCSGEVKTL